MKILHINKPFAALAKDHCNRRGMTALLWETPDIDLNVLYGRTNRLCLRINIADEIDTWDNAKKVGLSLGQNIVDTTLIQNIYALTGLAPRVYDVVKLRFTDSMHYAQVLEFLEHTTATEALIPPSIRELIEVFGRVKGIESYGVDENKSNYLCGKWVDFGKFTLNREKFKEYLKDLINREGRWSEKIYHDIPELGLKGWRHHKSRVADFKLDTFDFKDAKVLDIGGNLGLMGRELNDRGAIRVVNLDVAGIPNVAAHLDYYLGYFNNDHIHDCNLTTHAGRTVTLEKKTGIKKYDYLLFLAVCNHVEFREDFSQIADTVIFEGHHFTTHEEIKKLLNPFYKKLKFIGTSSDGNNRLIYIGTNL